MIPVRSLFEAHLTVADLDRSMAFYKRIPGLQLARMFPERGVAFYWIGGPGESMLGLWQVGTTPQKMSLHVAFSVNLDDLLQAPERLKAAGVAPRDFDGEPAEEPVVLAWMPAASVFFHDPDGNLLEYLSMLPHNPRPELGVIRWSEWERQVQPS